MINRREAYRQAFESGRRPAVQVVLPGGATRAGTILDLSVGGLRAQLPGSLAAHLPARPWHVSFALAAEQPPVQLPAEHIHVQAQDPPAVGLHFLPLVDFRAQEEIEKRIWLYLLEEQRRERKLRRAG